MTTVNPMHVVEEDAVGFDGEPVPPLPARPVSEGAFVEWMLANDVRAEWVDGEIELMPGIDDEHSKLTVFLVRLLGDLGEAHDLGHVRCEPTLVRLPAQFRQRSPDVFYFRRSRESQLRRHCFEGAPDLVVEIISPESRDRDTAEKFAEYEAAGVPEYWLPDPERRAFTAFTLGADGRYARLPELDGAVHSAVLPGLFFRPEWVRQLQYPKVAPLLAEMAAERARRLAGG